MRAHVLGALLALLPGLASAEVSVKLRGARLDLKAAAAPLSEILSQLARQTGMKVVNDGTLPPMILTLTLEDRTPVEAVFGVLQGLGLNYALMTDSTGMRVETLVMSGVAGPAGPLPPPVNPSRLRSPTQPALPPGPPEPSAMEEEPEAPEPASPAAEDSAAAGSDPTTEGAGPQTPGGPPRPRTYQPSTFTRPEQVLPMLPEQAFPSSPFAPRPPALVAPPVPEPGQPAGSPAQPEAQPTPPPQ